MKAYLDNAATTPLAQEVYDVMAPVLKSAFGNPSSTHAYGREVRGLVEGARRTVAQLLNTTPGEIIFTSGGTEADNMAIKGAVYDLGVKHFITSPLEHHAVLHAIEAVADINDLEVHYLKHDQEGALDLDHLIRLLKAHQNAFVSLMHANNEIGNLIDLHKVGSICREHEAIFHSDTVQTMGHYPFDLQQTPVDFITGAAHKFHGPKGVGFLYVNKRLKIKPIIHGGAQERDMRGGTENVYGIVGLEKALSLSCEHREEHHRHISELKQYMISALHSTFEQHEVKFNGMSADEQRSLYTVLNVSLPPTDKAAMLLFNLDINGVACSGGSACSSGSSVGSHVLKALHVDPNRPAVRFSFSRYTTKAEIDHAVNCLKSIYNT